MNIIKKITMLLFVAATIFATSCGKEDTDNTSSDSLVGTTWKNGATTAEWATLEFTSATAVTYTEGLREEFVSFTGTYTYTAPNGVLHFIIEGDPEDYNFTVNGNSMTVSGINLTFTKQ